MSTSQGMRGPSIGMASAMEGRVAAEPPSVIDRTGASRGFSHGCACLARLAQVSANLCYVGMQSA